jgi:hypothetical protein
MILLIAGIVFVVNMSIRSNRTYFYYALLWFVNGILLLNLIRIFEVSFSQHQLLIYINRFGIVLLSAAIPLSINLIYTIIFRKMLPFILQMISGAAALACVLFFMPYADYIFESYRTGSYDIYFLFFVWGPSLIYVVTVPLVSIAIKYCLINISSLAVERVLAGSPDIYICIDKTGKITDHNMAETVWGRVRDRGELFESISHNSYVDENDNLIKLRKAILSSDVNARGEIRLKFGESDRWFNWAVIPLKNHKSKKDSLFLLLSDRTAIRKYLIMLSRQNDELQKANTELADYELLVDKYTELAARQEVADYIDISVRYRIMQSFDQAKQMKQENSDSDISKIALDQLQQECRRALADVRSLVKKISS